jgi:hypothetical protein
MTMKIVYVSVQGGGCGRSEFTVSSSGAETEERQEENASQDNRLTTFRTQIENV